MTRTRRTTERTIKPSFSFLPYKMKASRGLLFFLFFIIILSAGTHALSFRGPETLNVCQCQTLHYTYSLSADEGGQYAFSAAGGASRWLTLYPKTVIGPGTEDVQAYFDVPCDAAGTYPLSILVGHEGETWRLDETVRVDACDDFTVEARWRGEPCPCSTTEIYVDITNNNPVSRRVTLPKIETPAGPITFAPSTVTIGAGKTETLAGFIDLSCEYAGEMSVPFTIRSGSSEKVYSMNLSVKGCDNLTVTHPPQATVCEGEQTALSVTVKNQESRPLGYRLSTQTPFANVSKEAFALRGGDQREHSLYLTPQRFFGNETVGITVEGPFRDDTYPIPVRVRNCHATDVTFFQAGPYLGANVTNTGRYTETYILSVTPKQDIYTYCEESNMTNMTGTPYCGPVRNITLGGNHTTTLFLANTSIHDGMTLSLQPEGQPVAYRHSTQPSRSWGLIGLYILIAILILLFIIFLVMHRPRKEARPKKRQKKVKGQKSGERVDSTDESLVHEEGNKKRWYGLWLIPLLILIILILLVVCVIPMDLDRYGLSGYFSNLFSPSNETYNETLPVQNYTVNVTDNASWSSNVTPGMPETPFTNDSGNVTANVTESSPYANQSCFITWNNNERLDVNLTQYFEDPDGDALNISISRWPQRINVSIQDGVVTLYPTSFEGRDAFALSADDGFGGTVTTGELVICARDGDMGFVSDVITYVDAYRYYVVLGFVLLVVIIMVTHLLERRRPEKEEE